MDRLVNVLPFWFQQEYRDTPAYKMLNEEVTAEHGLDIDNAAWPGPHKHVHCWWSLSNGYAVAMNVGPEGHSFPVIKES